MKLLIKLSFRNLWRNPRRTMITATGVGIGAALLIVSYGIVDGMNLDMVRQTSETSGGHIEIENVKHIDRAIPFETFSFSEEQAKKINKLDFVEGVTPRAYSFGLLGWKKNSAIAMLYGVDPKREQQVTKLAGAVSEGSWLSDKPYDPKSVKEIILGYKLAKRLGVNRGEKLSFFTQAVDGSSGAEPFIVTGILKTGLDVFDFNGAFVNITGLQEIMVLEGHVHSVLVKTDDVMRAPERIEDLQKLIDSEYMVMGRKITSRTKAKESPRYLVSRAVSLSLRFARDTKNIPWTTSELKVRSWKEIHPDISAMIQMNDMSMYFLIFIIYLVAALGVLNSQLMALFERTHELGIMVAVGMKRSFMVFMVLIETAMIGVIGAIIGLVLGLSLDWYLLVYGLDLSSFSGGFTYAGVFFEPVFYAEITMNGVISPVVSIFFFTLAVAVVPALRTARLDPVESISHL